MKESVSNIFKHNIKLIGEMDKAIYYFREQEYDKALYLVANSMDEINLVLESIIKDREYFNLVDTESMLMMLTGILNAKKDKDFILLTDLLELQLINFLIGVQELIISKEEIVFDEDRYSDNINLLLDKGKCFPEDLIKPIDTAHLLAKGYRVEFTSCGLMTLAAENDNAKFYFHTNNRIVSESFLLARHWYQPKKKKYILYGFGMGYHVSELKKLAKEAVIEVYESDLNVMKLACAFSDVSRLLQDEQVKLYYDPNLEMFNEHTVKLEKDEAMIIHYPSYKNIRNKEAKKRMEGKLPCINTL